MTTATWIAAYLLASTLVAVIVGKAIKHSQRDTDEFRRNLPNPNRDNDRDDLGGDS